MTDLEDMRDSALGEIVASLRPDARFVAAWLGGSFGRGEQDAYSDLDLWIVVSAAHADEICALQRPSGAGTTSTRRDIVSIPGEPVIVHEHHANAPGNGAFTAVVYASGLAADWTFLPEREARRPAASRMLFDRAGIPMVERSSAHDPQEVVARLSERHMFFWLLAVPAAKAWRRDDPVKFHEILALMHGAAREIDHLLRGSHPAYSRHSLAPFCATSAEQKLALERVCERMAGRASEIRAAGAHVPDAPDRVLDRWLTL